MKSVRFVGKHTHEVLPICVLMKGGELEGEAEDQIQTQ